MTISKKKSNGISFLLSPPDDLETLWKGSSVLVEQLRAAWDTLNDTDQPMTPCIIGKSGMGKTTLAVHCSRTYYNKDIYFFHASPVATPLSLFCNPHYRGKTHQASPLLSAMLTGGTFVLEESFKLNEESWSFLLPLLDERQYLRSPIDGSIIRPVKQFRFVATIYDSHPFEISEQVYSRLSPRIHIEYPDKESLKSILTRKDIPQEKDLVNYLVGFMKKQQTAISIRDGKNILNFSTKLCQNEDLDYQTAVHNSAKLIFKQKRHAPSSALYKIK